MKFIKVAEMIINFANVEAIYTEEYDHRQRAVVKMVSGDYHTFDKFKQAEAYKQLVGYINNPESI